MLKKWFCVLLVLGLVIGLVGCGKTEDKDNTQGSSGNNVSTNENEEENSNNPETWLTDEKENLSIWYRWSNDYIETPHDIPAVQKMEELTNVHIDYVLVDSTGATEKYGLMLASGDYPDIIFQAGQRYPGGLEKGVTDGVLVDMTEYVASTMHTYREIIESDPEINRNVKTDSGKYIGFYSLTSNDAEYMAEKAWAGMGVRKDWLDQVGLDVPVTIDDWTEMLTAFQTELGVEHPLVIGNTGHTMSKAFVTAYGVTDGFYLDGDTIKYGPAETGYKEYLALMADWYQRGFIDPNFLADTNGTNFIYASFEDVVNGKTGAFPTMNHFICRSLGNMGYEISDEFYIQAVQNPVLNEGDVVQYRQTNNIVNDCHAVVTTNCEDLELAAKWIDFQYTETAMLLNNYGLEGEDEGYTVDAENNRYHLSDNVMNNQEGYTPSDAHALNAIAAGPGNVIGRYNWQRLHDMQGADVLDGMDIWNQDGNSMVISNFVSMTEEEGAAYNTKYTDIQTATQEYTVNVITGVETVDNFDDFVETLYQLGLEECIGYQQAAYDRYLNR